MNTSESSDQPGLTAGVGENPPSLPPMNTQQASESEDGDFVPGFLPSTGSSKKKRSHRRKNVVESPSETAARRKRSRRASQDEYPETAVTKKRYKKKNSAVPKIAKQGKKTTKKSHSELTEEDLRLLGSVDVGSEGRSGTQTPVNDDINTGNMNTGEIRGAIPSASDKFEKGFEQPAKQFTNTLSEPSSQPQAFGLVPTSNIFTQPTISANGNSFLQGNDLVYAGMGGYEDRYQAQVPSGDIFGMQSQMNHPPQAGHTQENNSSVHQGFPPQQQSFNDGFNPHMNSYISDLNGYQTGGNDFMGPNYAGHFPGFGAQHPDSATNEWGSYQTLPFGDQTLPFGDQTLPLGDQTLPLPPPLRDHTYNNIMTDMNAGRFPMSYEGGMMMPDFHRPAGVEYQDFTLYGPPNNNNYMASGPLGNSSQFDGLGFQQTIGMPPQEAQEELEDPSMAAAGLETSGYGTFLQHEQPYQPPHGFEAFGPAVQGEQLDNAGVNLGQLINPQAVPALQAPLATSVPYGRDYASNANIILQQFNMRELTKAIQQGINWIPRNQYHLAVYPDHQVPVTVNHQLPTVFGQYIFEQCLWFFQRHHERTLALKGGRSGESSATLVAEFRATFGIRTSKKKIEKVFRGMENDARVLFNGLFMSSEFLYWDFQRREPCRIMALPEFSLLDQPERAYNWLNTVEPLAWARDLIEFVNSYRSQTGQA
ncbi:hypothetical protein BDZ45DRAFT_735003 [Acephala macrosclerotiorum]|nr:hypothetical protein BDZ45DRAFT_735003 [Acephala macrosclerotiorum]